jgi:hypothetical protein
MATTPNTCTSPIRTADSLIAGHRNPQAADDDARRQIDEGRRHIADFEAAVGG